MLSLSLLFLTSFPFLYSYSSNTLQSSKKQTESLLRPSSYDIDIDSNNHSNSISKDKQLHGSLQQNMTNVVIIVENASNPTNKIFYEPSPITIKKGGMITWINKDPTIHTVTSGKTDNDLTDYRFDSKMMALNSTFTHIFNKEGLYYYHCYVHPFMMGSVTVVS